MQIEENNRMGKTRDLFKKMRYQGNISCKDGHKKGKKWCKIKKAEDVKKRWQEFTEELFKKIFKTHNRSDH